MSQKLLNLNTRKLYSIDYALSPLPNGGGANLTALIADLNAMFSEIYTDGSLPVLTFLHLVSSSDMVNTGVDVGLTKDCDNRTIPIYINFDLGPFEYYSGIQYSVLMSGEKVLMSVGKVLIIK
jgi:hypothetical protein